MNQILQKLGFIIVVLPLMFGGFSTDAEAQELNTVWERSNRTDAEQPLPEWFEASHVRGMAYGVVDGDGRLYAVDRNNTTIRILDAETGADIEPETPYDLSGVSGGLYLINDGDMSDDGNLFVGSLSTEANTEDGAFQLYMWEDEGGAFSSSHTIQTEEEVRLGDNFTVTGSVEDNTVEIWIPVQSSDPGVIYIVTTDDQGDTWNTDTMTLTGDNVTLPSNAAVGFVEHGGDFYVAGNGSAPKRYTNDGEYIEDTVFDSSNFTNARNSLQIFEVDGVQHLAAFTYHDDPDIGSNTNRIGRVYVYDISDPTVPVRVGETPRLGDDVDGFSSVYGDVYVSINEDNTYNVYAVEGVNGFAAFTNQEPPEPESPSNLFFSEYIEGSSNNKALEILNNTDSTIALTNYQIAQSSNGDGWEFYHNFAEEASIEGGETYVLITDQVDTGLFAHENADEVLGFPSPIHFNGNDARALIHIDPASNDTTFLDVFGDPDDDSDWDVAGVAEATTEQTLLRKESVTEGNTEPLDSFGTDTEDSEWIVNDRDDFSNLGYLSSEEGAIPPLAGDYYIPQGENDQGFASLAESFNRVNEAGISSAVNIYISDDLDETSDSLKLDRNDLSETANLTIKPETGKSPTITVTGGEDGDGILLQETAWVTIDGSNEPGGNTRDMSITSADTAFSSVIYVYGSSNVTIKNTNLSYTGDVSGTIGIAADVDETSSVENLVVENNTVGSSDGEFKDGVAVWGSEANPTQATVTNNDIYARHRGITTFWNLDNTFDGNRISIVDPLEDQGFYSGIYLVLTLGETNVVNNEVKTLAVNRTSDEGAGYAAGIVINATLNVQNIYNNTFATPDFTNIGDAEGNSVYGIVLNNAAGNSENSIYHNSFRIGSSSETGVHAAFGIRGVTSTDQDWTFTNNLYSIENDTDNSFAYDWAAENDEFSSDYNNYDLSGSAGAIRIGEDRFDELIDWTPENGQDENSSEVAVEFESESDLRLTGSSIGDENLAGVPLSAVTTDIDGEERSSTAPYKGAFEGDDPLIVAGAIGTFALTSPDSGTELELIGDEEAEVEITWEEPESEESLAYTWQADSVDGDFSEPLLSLTSDDDGAATTLTLTYGELDSALEGIGVEQGESIDLIWTVTAENDENERLADESFDITVTRNLGVSREITENPKEFSLSQNYPNPFNPTSTIEFTLPASADVMLEVYNINGQLVSTLVDTRMNAGEHSVVFDASNLASGVYLYRIRAGNFMETKQMTLIK